MNTPASAPAGSLGVTSIKITNPDTTSVTVASAFTYTNGTAPTITSVSPNVGAYNANTIVTLTGTGFPPNFVAAGGTVLFGGQAATGLAYISPTQITATVRPMLVSQGAGNINAVITNPDGLSGTLASAFTYNGFRVPENDTGLQNMIYYRYFHGPSVAPDALLPGGVSPGGVPVVPLTIPTVTVNGTPVAAITTPLKTGFQSFMEFASNPFLPDGVPQFTQSGSGSPDATWTTDNYDVEYWGVLNVPTTGLWTLSTGSDDGSYFILGDANNVDLVASNNFAQGTTFRSGTRALTAGRHRFVVQFAEGGGGNELRVHWSGPGQPEEVIPQGSADGTARGFYCENAPTLTQATPTPAGVMAQAGGAPITVTGTNLGSYVRKLELRDTTNTVIGTYTNPFPATGTLTVTGTTTLSGFNSPAVTLGGPVTTTITTVAGQTFTLPGGLPNGLQYNIPLITWVGNGGNPNWSTPANWNLKPHTAGERSHHSHWCWR